MIVNVQNYLEKYSGNNKADYKWSNRAIIDKWLKKQVLAFEY